MKLIPRNSLFSKILLTAGFLFFVFQFGIADSRFFQIASLKYQDFFVRFNYHFKKPPVELKDIVIIKIDEESVAHIGKRLPWSREIIAQALANINLRQPAVVVLDLAFMGNSIDPNEDIALIQEIARSKQMLFCSYRDERAIYRLPPETFLKANPHWGFVNRIMDGDYISRQAVLVDVDRFGRAVQYSVALKAAALFLGCPLAEIKFNGEEIIMPTSKKGLVKISVPSRKRWAIPVNFSADLVRFSNISFWRVLEGAIPAEFLKDKVVFVGYTSNIFQDVHPTPLGRLPGPVLIANDVVMLISGNIIRYLPEWLDILMVIISCWLAAYFFYRFALLKSLTFNLFFIAAFFAATFITYYRNYSGQFFSPISIMASFFLAAVFYKYASLFLESINLKNLAITDELTGLYIYRYFVGALQNEFKKAKVGSANLSLVIMDIDNFKSINDTYGHEQGNVILKTLASILRESTRQADVLCRYGGEEFVLILKDTSQAGAMTYAEKIRQAVADYDFPKTEGTMKVTLSLGVCGLKESLIKTANDLIECADSSLYRAKKEGKNRVCGFEGSK